MEAVVTDAQTLSPPPLRVGDSHRWTVQLSALAGWALQYRLVGPARLDIPLVESAPGAFDAALSTAQTGTLAPGGYVWVLIATKDAERSTIADGVLQVAPDVVAAFPAGTDLRTHARRVLDAIESVIEGRAGTDAQQLTIRGRTIAKTPLPDLLLLRDRYKAEALREEAAAGLTAPRNKLHARFVR